MELREPPLPLGQPPPQPDVGITTTLLVKHLPCALPLDTLKRLFSHYGASDIRPCVAGRLKNCAFVDFKDEVQAARAQSQLHRLRFLGKILAVERAKPYPYKAASDNCDGAKNTIAEGNDQPPPLPPFAHPPPQGGPQSFSSSGFSQAPMTVGGHRNEPIARSLGVDYPFPPHLEYAYPPPDGNILTNIVNALIAVPRFYTQVLHLMNKMNIPAPFRPALPTPPLAPPPPEPSAPKFQVEDLSSDESELESSDETRTDGMGEVAKQAEIGNEAVRKRARFHVSGSSKKTTLDKASATEVAGGKPIPLIPKEKPIIKKRQPVLQINISSKGLLKEHMHDKVEAGLEEADQQLQEENVEQSSSATLEELEAGRMPANEILALPMFKSYKKGIPSPVLYIKNLAKDITQEDLLYVFGAMFPRSENAKSRLGIKLMREGRMRGQAFVTFPSIDLAQDALNAVHGFLLKGKPMIIQFGRNPSVADTTVD